MTSNGKAGLTGCVSGKAERLSCACQMPDASSDAAADAADAAAAVVVYTAGEGLSES